VKAAPDAQRLLLHVQELDTRIQQLGHAAAHLPQLARLTELEARREELKVRMLAESGELEDARTELSRVAGDVELVEARIQRNTTRAAESASAKDAQALESELASLRKRLSDLEDIELAVMERIEDLEARAEASAAERDTLDAEIADTLRERDAELERLGRDRDAARADRDAVVGGVPGELLELYERQRSRYGIGAALLRGGVSLGSNVALAPSDLDQIRRAAPDDVVLDPESGCILVRDESSGL